MMSLNWLLSFVGLAAVYACLVTVLWFALARLLKSSRGRAAVPLVLVVSFFVLLTQHPFPNPAELNCPVPSAEPQLRPFIYWETFEVLWSRDAGLFVWLGNRTVAATLMNFLICMAIGAALSRHVTKLWQAAVLGMALTLTVELTQLTGVWGLFPCAYRQFNVDDLILNSLGVICGFALVSGVIRRFRRDWPGLP